MPTLRSASKQSKLDDFKEGDAIKPQPARRKAEQPTKLPQKKTSKRPEPNTSAKRKSVVSEEQGQIKHQAAAPNKKSKTANNAKQAQLAADDVSELEKPIIINRSPVLQLWSATVAQFMYPEESWAACLSMGGTIASLCAITKGKSVGAIEPKDRSEEEEAKRQERKDKAKAEAREVEVMGFPLQMKQDAALLSGKPKPVNEGTVIGKFGGEEQYNRTKRAMQDALQSWKDDKHELNKKAFHMYEKFRPDVAKGMSGWGRKGELNLHTVASTIQR